MVVVVVEVIVVVVVDVVFLDVVVVVVMVMTATIGQQRQQSAKGYFLSLMVHRVTNYNTDLPLQFLPLFCACSCVWFP
jgi:hypothetical protein